MNDTKIALEEAKKTCLNAMNEYYELASKFHELYKLLCKDNITMSDILMHMSEVAKYVENSSKQE